MKVHIGSEIAKIQKQRGIQNDDFARMINTSVRNLNNIKLKDDLMLGQLFKISEVLDFNFFTLISPIVVEQNQVKEAPISYSKNSKKHTINFQVQYSSENADQLGKFMLHVDAIADKMGYNIL